ncbi:MAG: 4Fe-4S ferredoxin [Chloroflexi bacterium]|nr:MAG: 4Fe-4S ferredoxin [Chloroflexota bacterium]RLC84622.1 MAG: 4Fe-4S ferredoxin [Chloroflexota bacterium]HEY71910.1 4Fe-4S binding protein [Thermoflexia bacterium]
MDAVYISPQVDRASCTLCGLCVEACRCHVVEMGERGPVFNCELCPSTGACDCWYLCEEVCPTGAITCAFEIVAASAI